MNLEESLVKATNKVIQRDILLKEAAGLIKDIVNFSSLKVSGAWYSPECNEWVKKYDKFKRDKA